MSDEYQIHIPPSFEAVYADARGRRTVGLDHFRTRYELCEDMAQLLVEHSQALHHDLGLSEDLILARHHAGLSAAESGFEAVEAQWVVRRLAELLGWPPSPPSPPSSAPTLR